MDQFPERIEVGETVLRPMAERDLPSLQRHLGEASTARWMAGTNHPFTRKEAEELFALARDPAQRIRVLERRGQVIGGMGLSPDLWHWLDPAERGRGVMAETLQAAIAAHFATPSHPLTATCRQDNAPSQKLLSRLGFARKPKGRRMFFPVEGGALPCDDYVMTSGQWMLLQPPTMEIAGLKLRPAGLKDAPRLSLLLPRAGQGAESPWPAPENLLDFIERHRCRNPGTGFFVVEGPLGSTLGIALLLDAQQAAEFRFATAQDDERYRTALTDAMNSPAYETVFAGFGQVCAHDRPELG